MKSIVGTGSVPAVTDETSDEIDRNGTWMPSVPFENKSPDGAAVVVVGAGVVGAGTVPPTSVPCAAAIPEVSASSVIATIEFFNIVPPRCTKGIAAQPLPRGKLFGRERAEGSTGSCDR